MFWENFWGFFLFLSTLLKELLRLGGIAGVTVVTGRVRRPEGEVVSEQLHDKRRILVAVLVEGVELSDGLIECLRRKMVQVRSASETQVIYIEFLNPQRPILSVQRQVVEARLLKNINKIEVRVSRKFFEVHPKFIDQNYIF